MRALEKKLIAAGAEALAPTNPYEILRFRTSYGVGIVYQDKKGNETWNEPAIAARKHLLNGSGSLAPVKIAKRKGRAGLVEKILKRDGTACFFCARDLEDDITKEHLVPVAHGGPDHASNIFLAHAACNQRAGHLSAPEKIAIHVRARIKMEALR